MKVTILSYDKFMAYIPERKEDFVAIRIGDSLYPNDAVEKRYLDVLKLDFYDFIEYAEDINHNTPYGSNRVNSEDAKLVNEFIEKYADKNFVIHCERGMRRSPAVGYWVLKKLGYEDELRYKKDSSMYMPNVEVYGMISGRPYTKQNSRQLREELK